MFLLVDLINTCLFINLQVKAPKVGANDVGMKRKLKIEDAKHSISL